MAPELLKERQVRQAKIAGEINIDTSGGTMLVFAPYILRKGSIAGYAAEVLWCLFQEMPVLRRRRKYFNPN